MHSVSRHIVTKQHERQNWFRLVNIINVRQYHGFEHHPLRRKVEKKKPYRGVTDKSFIHWEDIISKQKLEKVSKIARSYETQLEAKKLQEKLKQQRLQRIMQRKEQYLFNTTLFNRTIPDVPKYIPKYPIFLQQIIQSHKNQSQFESCLKIDTFEDIANIPNSERFTPFTKGDISDTSLDCSKKKNKFVELHIHLEGSIKPSTLWQLSQSKQISMQDENIDENVNVNENENVNVNRKEYANMSEMMYDLQDFDCALAHNADKYGINILNNTKTGVGFEYGNHFFQRYNFITKCLLNDLTAVYRTCFELCQRQYLNGIEYTEVRINPLLFVQKYYDLIINDHFNNDLVLDERGYLVDFNKDIKRYDDRNLHKKREYSRNFDFFNKTTAANDDGDLNFNDNDRYNYNDLQDSKSINSTNDNIVNINNDDKNGNIAVDDDYESECQLRDTIETILLGFKDGCAHYGVQIRPIFSLARCYPHIGNKIIDLVIKYRDLHISYDYHDANERIEYNNSMEKAKIDDSLTFGEEKNIQNRTANGNCNNENRKNEKYDSCLANGFGFVGIDLFGGNEIRYHSRFFCHFYNKLRRLFSFNNSHPLGRTVHCGDSFDSNGMGINNSWHILVPNRICYVLCSKLQRHILHQMFQRQTHVELTPLSNIFQFPAMYFESTNEIPTVNNKNILPKQPTDTETQNNNEKTLEHNHKMLSDNASNLAKSGNNDPESDSDSDSDTDTDSDSGSDNDNDNESDFWSSSSSEESDSDNEFGEETNYQMDSKSIEKYSELLETILRQKYRRKRQMFNNYNLSKESIGEFMDWLAYNGANFSISTDCPIFLSNMNENNGNSNNFQEPTIKDSLKMTQDELENAWDLANIYCFQNQLLTCKKEFRLSEWEIAQSMLNAARASFLNEHNKTILINLLRQRWKNVGLTDDEEEGTHVASNKLNGNHKKIKALPNAINSELGVEENQAAADRILDAADERQRRFAPMNLDANNFVDKYEDKTWSNQELLGSFDK